MRTAKYPIHLKPRPEFVKRMKAEADPEWVVSDMEFVQWTKNRWSARWRWGRKEERFTSEFELGGAEPTLEAIEARVIKALKPDGTL